MAAALQAQEIMQLLPCTGKPVAAAILQARKLCNCCPARENLWWLQYKRSKLCSCFHMQQSLWLLLGKILQLLPCAGKPVVAAIQAREIMQLVPCAAKAAAVSSAGIHANCRCKHAACFTSGKRALSLKCWLRTVWTLEGVSWTLYTNFLTSSNLIF